MNHDKRITPLIFLLVIYLLPGSTLAERGGNDTVTWLDMGAQTYVHAKTIFPVDLDEPTLGKLIVLWTRMQQHDTDAPSASLWAIPTSPHYTTVCELRMEAAMQAMEEWLGPALADSSNDSTLWRTKGPIPQEWEQAKRECWGVR